MTQIENAVKTYFATLCSTYERQVNPQGKVALAYNKKTRQSGLSSRIKMKYLRRFGAVSPFETKHNVSNVRLLVHEELMSSEDDEPGSVPEDTWKARANKCAAKGQKAVEVHYLECRSLEVSVMLLMPHAHRAKHVKIGQPPILCTGPAGIPIGGRPRWSEEEEEGNSVERSVPWVP